MIREEIVFLSIRIIFKEPREDEILTSSANDGFNPVAFLPALSAARIR